MSRLKLKNLSVGLGFHDISNLKEGYVAPIEKMIMHPRFESDDLHDIHDISLIKLKDPIKFTENIKPICLPTPGENSMKLLLSIF